MGDIDVESLLPEEDKKKKKPLASVVLHVSTRGCRLVTVRSKHGYFTWSRKKLTFWNSVERPLYTISISILACVSTLVCALVFGNLYDLARSDLAERQGSMNCIPTPYQRGHSSACTPVTNIFFLKTHKCASSSFQNILMRFGDERNLTFVLPSDTNYFGHPEKFSRSMVSIRQPTGGFNILCHHLRLDVAEVRSVLRPSSVFLTILRDPVNLFRSMYDYYEISNHTKQTLDQFMRNESSMEELATERFRDRIGNNQMLFDLGYDVKNLNNDTEINYAIQEVDNTFDFVMVSELFDESLILLKHMLCWGMEDILYLVHNRRMTDPVKSPYYNSTSQKIRDYNRADQMLYDYFLKKLDDAIEKFGREKMAQEVEDLRIWNKVWFNHCVEKISVTDNNVPKDNRAYSSEVHSFVLKEEPIASMCRNLAMAEIPYTDKLTTKQKQMF